MQMHQNQVRKAKTDTNISSIPPTPKPTSSLPVIKQKTNAEGLVEHAERLEKFQKLDTSMVQMGPPRLSNGSPIQPKLTIGAPGDVYEQEADRVAKQVVTQIHSPKSLNTPSSAQRQDLPEQDELMMKPIIQRHNGPKDANPNLEQAINQSRGGGRPLDDTIRGPMEQAFGANFGGVRVHSDTKAHQLNESIQARAFTTGQDLFFRQGAYQPGSRVGQELLAHELTHVVQQNGLEKSSTSEVQRLNRKTNGSQDTIQSNEAFKNVFVSSESINNVIQCSGKYTSVEQKAKGSQKISQTELEEATKEWLEEMVKDEGYKDAEGKTVDTSVIQGLSIVWGEDYGVNLFFIDLPSVDAVTQDIKNGTFKMILRHEMSHYIRSTDKDPAALDEVDDLVNSIDLDKLIAKYPSAKGQEEHWKEEIRADLQSVVLKYRENKCFPSDSELKAYEASLGAHGNQGMDSMHPPANERVKYMKTLISRLTPSKCCYLTTACIQAKNLPDDCEELTLLRQFRDNYLVKKKSGSELIDLYYQYSPMIVRTIEEDEDKDLIYRYIYTVIRKCVDAIKKGELEDTYKIYCEMVVKLKKKFIPNVQVPKYKI